MAYIVYMQRWRQTQATLYPIHCMVCNICERMAAVVYVGSVFYCVVAA